MAVVDLTTSLRIDGAFWQAASSCIVPMTLISFIAVRPPALSGVAMTFMCTTVSTSACAITLAISGLRMSARTNSVRPRVRLTSGFGATVSTPITRSIDGSACSTAASRLPRNRLTPVTRTTRGGTGSPLCEVVREERAVSLCAARFARNGEVLRVLPHRRRGERALRLGLQPGDHERVAAAGPQRPRGAALVDRDRHGAEGVLAHGQAPARHLAVRQRERQGQRL